MNYLPNVVRMIKSMMLGWAVHVARIGNMKNVHGILVEYLKGRDHLEELGVCGNLRALHTA
jgi:hypothetical protein